MAEKPDLSIVIVSYNTKQITKNCLESIKQSLQNTTIKYEVIVVDNASTDDSQSQISRLRQDYGGQAKFKTIFNTNNVGFAKANNQAVKEARGKYLLFLNSDIIVLDNAIEKLFQFYQQNEKTIHFLGGKLLNKDLTSQASCGPAYSLPMVFAHLFLRGDYWGLTRSSPNQVKEVDWVSGACILTKKEYFQKINGFDEKIFMYMDEIDLLFRAKKKGYRVFFYPKAEFIHLGSASSGGRTYPILQVFKGLLYFYKKHYSIQAIFLLKIMLKLKSLVAYLIGKITRNQYLTKTYEEAFRLVEMA